MKFVLLLAILVSGLVYSAHSCTPSAYSCYFYECFEQNKKCGPNGYALSFGNKYCKAFSSREFRNQDVNEWKNVAKKCLQTKLLGKENLSCGMIEEYAFGVHPECYIKAGFCGIVRKCLDVTNWNGYCADLKDIAFTVDNVDLVSRKSLKSIKEIIVQCSAKVPSRIMNAIFGDDDDDIVSKLGELEHNRAILRDYHQYVIDQPLSLN